MLVHLATCDVWKETVERKEKERERGREGEREKERGRERDVCHYTLERSSMSCSRLDRFRNSMLVKFVVGW